MRVAVIGVGNVGGALADSLTRAGHTVVVAASEAEKAKQVAAGLDCEPAASAAEATLEADAVIVAVPFGAGEDVAAEIRDNVSGKPVVDVTNGPQLVETGRTNAEDFQAWLPEAQVVKAFNTIFATNLGSTNGKDRLDGYIAGDDADAKATVATLVEDAGLSPLDVGDLKMARVLEGMAWANISLNMANGWPWKSAWKLER